MSPAVLSPDALITAHWLLEGLALALLLNGLIFPLLQWNRLPEEIPIHFGITGKPDRWGRRGMLALFLTLQLVWYIAFSTIGGTVQLFRPAPEWTPDESMLLLVKTCGVLLFSYTARAMVRVALQQAERLNMYVVLGAAACLAAAGFVRSRLG